MLYSDYLKMQKNANKGAVSGVPNSPTSYTAPQVTYGSMLGAVSPYSAQGTGQPTAGLYGNYINSQAVANGGNNMAPSYSSGVADQVKYSSAPSTVGGNVTYGNSTPNSVGDGTGDQNGNGGVKYSDNTAGDQNGENTGNVGQVSTPVRTDGIYGDYLAQREKAISDAQNSYAAFTSRYGTQAEQMAQSGMTGSGYSDYMKSRAYTQMRDETQAANATYAENVRRADATIREAYANDLIGFNNGTYTEADIDALATKNSYSAEQVEGLRSAAAEYTKKAQDDYFYTLKEKVTAGTLTLDEILSATERNDISTDHRDTLVNEIIPNMYKDSEGKIITREEAQKKLDKVMKEFGDSSEVYKNATKQYNNLFGAGATISQDEIKYTFFGSDGLKDNELESVGNNFNVKVRGKTYHLESKGLVKKWSGAALFAKAEGYNTDTMFKYGSGLYFYRDGKVYEIGTRAHSYSEDVKNLLKVLNGG